MAALHLTGPVVVDGSTVVDQAWVVDGAIRYEDPGTSAQRLDGVVLPGLVDMHCHVGLTRDGETDQATAVAQAITDRNAGTLLIRDAGSATDTSFVHERADLPRLIRAGRFIARPKRYLPHFAREIEVHELPEVVAQEARRGDGWVKIIADWIDRSLGADADLTPLWPTDVLVDAVAAAHEAGAQVTAHTFATEAMEGLFTAGVDCIEHGTGMMREHMQEAAHRGVPVVPTLLQIANFEGFADQAQGKYDRFADRMRALHSRRYQQVRELADHGVTLLMGTDAGGTIEHGSVPAEARLWVEAGLSAELTVAGATWLPRSFLGQDTLTDGASADLVVYDWDPRADIAALAQPRTVVLRGEVVWESNTTEGEGRHDPAD